MVDLVPILLQYMIEGMSGWSSEVMNLPTTERSFFFIS